MELAQDHLQKQALVSRNGSPVSPNRIVLGWFEDSYRHHADWYTDGKYWNTLVVQLNKTGNVRTYVIFKCVHVTIVPAKAISITYSECGFLDSGIQYAKCMRHIVICGLPAFTILSTLSYKRYDFRGKKLLNIKLCFVDFLYSFYLRYISF